MTKMLAMILAGGRGKRMDILCHVRPKPTLAFAGGFRVIDFSLSNCVHSGISDIAVLTDYWCSSMADYLKRWHSTNSSPGSFQILEPGSGHYRNTADAVYQNLDYLRNSECNTVLILPADHVYKMDYRKMLAFHERVRADLTVGVVSVAIEQAYRFGNIILDAGGRITAYIEKPDTSQSNLVSMGIFVFDKKVLIERLIEDSVKTGEANGFERAIIPGMLSQGKVFAYQFRDHWQDIGNPKAYFEANMDIIGQTPSFSLNGNWPVLGERQNIAVLGKTEQGRIENSIVSPGCVIKGRVENSILSPGVWVEEQAVVKNSILMPDVFVGYHSIVDQCILDEGVDIGRYSYIGFGASLVPGEWDITVVGKEATVPEHTAIGRDCRILPHVRQSDFLTNMVPPGTIISQRSVVRDLPLREKVVANER